jgi:sigma-B regulation protein RsbU (phosphoserine phosphatase)
MSQFTRPWARLKSALRFGRRRPGVWGGIAYWSLVTAVVLFLLKLVPGVGSHISLSPWVATFVWIVASLPAFFRWMRWKLLWKLRNRLFVTYLLIGVTPVVLFGILAATAAYVLFGQFANFAATSEISAQLVTLAANNEGLALHLQQEMLTQNPSRPAETAHLPANVPSEARAMIAMPELRLGVYLDGQLQPMALPPNHALTDVPSPPAWVKGNFSGLVLSHDHVFFRAITSKPAGPHWVSVITSLPLDANFLGRVANGLGRVTLLSKVQIPGPDWQGTHTIGSARDSAKGPGNQLASVGEIKGNESTSSDLGTVAGGVLPKPANIMDIQVNVPATLQMFQWSTGNRIAVVALVTSRPSLLYQRLFRESLLMGSGIRAVFILTAVVFACLELLAIFLASRLSRTITRSVSDLYHATGEVDRGRLNYRIPVSRQDQLAALSRSFNTMSESLARLLDEQKEKERLQSELAIAQEVQSNLFPACDVRLGELELHGVCRPARTVSGDYYDFLVLGTDALFMAIGDISGKGISAALLMAGLHSAVRAYRFASEEVFAGSPTGSIHDGNGQAISAEVFRSPGNLMRLLNLHLYRSTQSEKYATLFLAHYEVSDCTLRYSNGGQLPPLVLRADGSILRLDQGGTVVGLLDNMQYEEGAVVMEPGDLLIAYSDGVTEPENEFGDFGEARMVELVRRSRHLPLQEITDRVMQALQDWIGADEQPDDITMVLARQR